MSDFEQEFRGAPDQSGSLTTDFVRRLNLLVSDTVHEGGTITSVAAALIGAGIELLMRSGATDDEIQRVCTGMSETLLPAVRASIVNSFNT